MNAKPPKMKAVKVRAIDADADPEPYRLLRELVAAHHDELVEARIALAWQYGWAKDPDGYLRLGSCQRVTDPLRQLAGVDVLIRLNADVYRLKDFGDAGRRALIDHELCHVARAKNDDDTGATDEMGRPVYRTVHHDAEEFVDISRRHGLWKHDLLRLAEAARQAADQPLLGQRSPTQKGPRT